MNLHRQYHRPKTNIGFTSLVSFLLPLILFSATSHAQTNPSDSAATVRLVVGYRQDLPVGEAQKWMKVLTEAGVDKLRLTVDPELKPKIAEQKSGDRISYSVTGRIDRRNRLLLPGSSFVVSDQARLVAWVKNLKSNSNSTRNDPDSAGFGLSDEQLVELHQTLARPYSESTRGQSVSQVVRSIRGQLNIPIGVDEVARAALLKRTKDEADVIVDELNGLSCGTVLASILRPLGLVLTIKEQGKRLEIVDSRRAKQHWPVGWPNQNRPSKVAPILFKQTEVEIEGFKLSEVLKAIEKKTEIPFILDQNNMARHGIELSKIDVNLGRQKTYYDKIIRLCLNEASPPLKSELRVDESGHPFLWISTR